MKPIDWRDFQKRIAKKLKEKMPDLNRTARKRHAYEVIEDFKNWRIDLSTEYLKELLTQLKQEIEVASEREKKNLEFRMELIAAAKDALDEIMAGEASRLEASVKIEDIHKKALEITEKYSGVIGRISLSLHTPATPSSFFFWIKDDESIHVEPGTIVTVGGENGERIVGIVEDVKAMSDVPSSINEFYSTGYGNPEQELSIERPTVREGNARVIKRSDGRVEPIIRKYPVFFATREEIIDAYAGHIKDKDKILVGFTYDERKQPVPVFADFQYIFGYKGAHFNIAGSSGLAAKTSYALFLIMSALSYAKKHQTEDIGIIAFNVKEIDLLRIMDFREEFKNLDQAIEKLAEHVHGHTKISAELWQEAKDNGVDPFDILVDENTKILEPDRDYKYGLTDIIELGENTPDIFRMMFDPQDIDDNFEALLSGIIDEFRNKSFQELDVELKEKLRGRTQRSQSILVGGIPIHRLTVDKFLRRLEVARGQLKKILEERTPRIGVTKRVPIHELKSGDIFIINIEPLPDRGKRLVFLSVLKMVNRILEAKREGVTTIRLWSDDTDISSFPKRVAIFIDELNKFAPRGKEYSPIKYPIIDIAARGRSIGLSLIGAEQMASQVDGEVLANCSTFALGRAHPVEIKDKSYDWVKGDLRERVTILKPGEIIMFHAIHNAPVLLNFPIPLHLIEEV